MVVQSFVAIYYVDSSIYSCVISPHFSFTFDYGSKFELSTKLDQNRSHALPEKGSYSDEMPIVNLREITQRQSQACQRHSGKLSLFNFQTKNVQTFPMVSHSELTNQT